MEQDDLKKFLFDMMFNDIHKSSNPYVFSIDENKEVNIYDIQRKHPFPRGKKCNCICPYCQGIMIAVFPKNKNSYFRHYDPEGKSECLKEKKKRNQTRNLFNF